MKNFTKLFTRLLVFFTITPFVLSLLEVIRSFNIQNCNINNLDFYHPLSIVLFCSGIFFLIFMQILNYKKATLNIQIILILPIILINFLICYKINNIPFFTYSTVFGLLLFIFEMIFNRVFIYYDNFISVWQGKSGQELETFLFHNNTTATDLAPKIRSTKTFLTIISFIEFIFTILINYQLKTLNLYTIILCAVFFINIFISFFFMRFIEKQSLYAFLGYDKIYTSGNKYVKMILLLLIISIVPSLFLSRNEAYLKINFNQFTNNSINKKEITSSQAIISSNSDLNFNLDEIYKEEEPNKYLLIFFTVLEYVFVILVVFFIIYFLILPFILTGWKKFKNNSTPKNFFHSIFVMFKNLFKFISSLFKKTGNKEYSKLESENFKNKMNSILKNSIKSKEKKLELDRLSEHFIKLIDWAAKKEIKYTNNLAPLEFTEKIIKNLSAETKLQNDLINCGKIFEKALYDKNILEKDEEKQFITSISNIINFEGN